MGPQSKECALNPQSFLAIIQRPLELISRQCEQIGRFFKFLGYIFSNNSCQKIWQFSRLLWKVLLFSKTVVATFWALFGNFGPLFIPTAGHTVSRLFYNHPLTRTLCRLVDVLSDVQKFRVADDGRLFANALHHSAKTSFLQNLLYSHYIARWAIYIT